MEGRAILVKGSVEVNSAANDNAKVKKASCEGAVKIDKRTFALMESPFWI